MLCANQPPPALPLHHSPIMHIQLLPAKLSTGSIVSLHSPSWCS